MSSDDLPTLRGPRVELRPAGADDAPAIAAIVAEPDVLPWWGATDVERIREDMEEVDSFAIVVDGEVAGWLLAYEEEDEDYAHVAFDVTVGGRWRGGGYGREALRVAIRHFAAQGHHRFTIDPAAENERAIRAYAAVGFKPVGVMREYERAPDGTWRDGLLMDLLAGELVEQDAPRA